MKHIVYADSDKYPIALLVKDTAFKPDEILNVYTSRMERAGISKDGVVVVGLPYNEKGKAPAPFIKEQLGIILSGLDGAGTTLLYCADANYFKALTKVSKADPHLGYALPCKIPGYTHMTVTLGINHKSLIYNPANEARLSLSVQTLIEIEQGNYTPPGENIIHSAYYPESVEAIKLALQELHQYKDLSCDIETASLNFNEAGIGTITFCWSEHEGIAFACDYRAFPNGPVNGLYGEMVENTEVRALLKQFFETYTGTLRYHRGTFDIKILVYALWMDNLLDTDGLLTGLDIMTQRVHDTLIIRYLATNSTAGNKLSLKEAAHEFAGNWAVEVKNILAVPLPQLLEYNLVDGLCTNYVFKKHFPEMVNDNQADLYYSLMLPSMKTIIQIELSGMPLNKEKVREARETLEGIIAEQTRLIQQAAVMRPFTERLQREKMEAANAKLKVKQHPLSAFAHVQFNPNSNPQKQALLYEEMGLPVIDLTDTKQPATGGDTLEKLINHTTNPEYKVVIKALIDYAKADKILSSFIPAFEAAIAKGDQDNIVYLHGSFNIGGTVSGRLSSSDPNLQNIPAGSTFGKLIKGCFQAPAGWLFGGADFNSLEDYISALTTKDPNKLKVYIEGYDGHCLRAFYYFPEQLPGITDTVDSINSIKKLFPDVRQESKAPTFALTYQGTKYTLMNNLGWDDAKATQVEGSYHEMYKVSDEWVQVKLDEASKTGYVEVAFGLRVRTPLLHSSIRNSRYTPYEAKAEGRTAGNALGQSYGLLNNRAANEFMQKVWASPYRHDIKPVALIHDAIYLLFRDTPEVVAWVNRELIKSMQWQELPEIQHDTVKLGAELSIFWPTWADELVLPNDADIPTIQTKVAEHISALKTKPQKAA